MRLLLVSALASLASAVLADDANWVGVGGAGNFAKNTQVQMVSEDVRIDLTNREMLVKATFIFKNHGPKTNVTMAFPDETSSNHKDIANQKQPQAIREFHSWVDGKPASLKHATTTKEDFQISTVWTKEVEFGAGQTRRVLVQYRATHGFAGAAWAMDYYILTTGATWKDKIGQCDITVNWAKATKLSRPLLDLTGRLNSQWKLQGAKSASISLRNIEPDFDLDLTMIKGFWNFTMNGHRLPLNFGLPEETEPAVKGSGKDLMLATDMIGKFFGTYDDSVEEWKSPEAKAFAGPLQWIDTRTLENSRGKRFKLARPWRGNYFYLKDLIKALGGTYRYDAVHDIVNLTLPRR